MNWFVESFRQYSELAIFSQRCCWDMIQERQPASSNSVTLGVDGDAISKVSLETAAKQQLLNANAVAYAITYIFGTAGTIWILSSVAPKLLSMNLPEACGSRGTHYNLVGELA